MTLTNAIVSDTETTGLDPADSHLLEVAAVFSPKRENGDLAWQSFVEFEGDIPPDAKSAHHIQEHEVRPGAPYCNPRAKVLERLESFATPDTAFVFHNAAFDLGFLSELKSYPVVCTYRVSLHVYPDAPSHKNTALMYWLNTKPDERLTRGLAAHRALFDAAVTKSLLDHFLEKYSIDELVSLSTKPILLKTVRFGKYKGETWDKLVKDSGYVAWMRRSGNWADDVDVMYTLDVLQGRRDAA